MGGSGVVEYAVIVYREAMHDIDAMYDYIANDLASPGVAREIIDKIKRKIFDLAVFPKTEQKLIGQNLIRTARVKHYTIFFQVDDVKKQVNVFRVLYSRRKTNLSQR